MEHSSPGCSPVNNGSLLVARLGVWVLLSYDLWRRQTWKIWQILKMSSSWNRNRWLLSFLITIKHFFWSSEIFSAMLKIRIREVFFSPRWGKRTLPTFEYFSGLRLQCQVNMHFEKGSGCSTVVEHMHHDPEVVGLIIPQCWAFYSLLLLLSDFLSLTIIIIIIIHVYVTRSKK